MAAGSNWSRSISADLKSVRDCASRLMAKGEAFDVVIANAGVMATPFGHTVEGFETQFGTNHLAICPGQPDCLSDSHGRAAGEPVVGRSSHLERGSRGSEF